MAGEGPWSLQTLDQHQQVAEPLSDNRARHRQHPAAVAGQLGQKICLMLFTTLFRTVCFRLFRYVWDNLSRNTPFFFQKAFKVDAGCIFRIEAETSNELAVSVHKLLSAWKIITDYSLIYCPVLCRKKRKYSTAQCGTNPWPDFGLKWEITQASTVRYRLFGICARITRHARQMVLKMQHDHRILLDRVIGGIDRLLPVA